MASEYAIFLMFVAPRLAGRRLGSGYGHHCMGHSDLHGSTMRRRTFGRDDIFTSSTFVPDPESPG
jgi:hypothetical protein